MFHNKKLLITGGTGSFGNAVLNKFLKSSISEIRIFSRDEKKQDDLRKKYNNKKLKFYIGDVRDLSSLKSATKNIDYIFHAAALKQVPSCEFYPMEAVKTNIVGSENVINCAIECGVKKVICLSTDKAVYPINAMGISKALMEKVIIAKSRESKFTKICITRYGNVMTSRGSVIPLFVDQILSGKPITITDPKMTRFMMTLEEAVNLVIYAFKYGKNGEIFVPKTPSCTIDNLAKAIKDIFNVPTYETKIIGTRHGEKLHEVLLSREELSLAKKTKNYFVVSPDLRDLNYDNFFKKGREKISLSHDYNSNNTQILNLNSMKKLLLSISLLQKKISFFKKKI